MDLTKIKEMEESPVAYWRKQALDYWRLYLIRDIESGDFQRKYERNIRVIRELRRQNRALRTLISDRENNGGRK